MNIYWFLTILTVSITALIMFCDYTHYLRDVEYYKVYKKRRPKYKPVELPDADTY